MPRLLVVAVLGAVLRGGGGVAAVVMARPLLVGGAEPPSAVVAAGPAGVQRAGGRPDRSIAGADVILVGFVAAAIVIIFWYIRITRKSSGSGSVGAGDKLETVKGPPVVVVEA
ncbi:hypothetical protein ABZP36_028481 [Zizania latifolia]